MKIDNEFTVSVPIERAWEVLTDLDGVARCLPGAELTGVDGDVYAGKIKIKVGPVISQYAGTARFIEKDDVAHRAVIDAKGKDSRGAGNANAMINASLRADGAHTVVTVSTDLNISGKIAQFGSGMIKEVSAKLLGQFVQNLETKLLAPAAGPDDGPAAADGSPEINGGTTTLAAAPGPEAVPEAAPAASAAAPASAAARPAPEYAPVESEPLDLMSLAGNSVYRRLIPVVAGAIVVGLIGYLIGRRGR